MRSRMAMCVGAAALLGMSAAAEAQVCYRGSRSGWTVGHRHAVSFGGARFSKPSYRSGYRPGYRGADCHRPVYSRPVTHCGPTYRRSSYYVAPRTGHYTTSGFIVADAPAVVTYSGGAVDRSRTPTVVIDDAGAAEAGVRAPDALEGVRRRSSIIVRPRTTDETADGTAEVAANGTSGDAWAMLSHGEARAALHEFAGACREENLPDGDERNLADVKAGYAIAAYVLEDEARTIWALRRAVQEDAATLHYLPISPEVRAIIEEMRAEARERAEEAGELSERDDWFIVSAASYLLHEHEAADEALSRAEDAGDRSRSAEALRAALTRMERDRGGDGA